MTRVSRETELTILVSRSYDPNLESKRRWITPLNTFNEGDTDPQEL